VYGMTFIILGNTAANSVAFGQNVLTAANAELTPGRVCGLALRVNLFCCLLHSISRKTGIWLINLLGTVKLLMIIFFLLIGIIWQDPKVVSEDLNIHTVFQRTSQATRVPFKYAEAVLFIMFPYSGFHQVNYVSCNVHFEET
jgi:amino acid transporter